MILFILLGGVRSMGIGKRIKELRLAKGMTLEELGNKVGVGKSTVRKWETGLIENMRRDKILKVAKALDCTVEYLLGLENSGCKTVYYSVTDTEGNIISYRKKAMDLFSGLYNEENDNYIYAYKELGVLIEIIKNSNSEQIETLKRLLEYYNQLTSLGKEEARKRIEELTYISKYTNNASETDASELNAAHARTDLRMTDEDLQNDEDIMNDDDF
jgi:transcriptional regulator with XRE-family HTH domain